VAVGRRAEIENCNAEFTKALAEKNVAALSAFYEEDGRFLVPGAPMAEGRRAIQVTLQGLLDAGAEALALDIVEVIDDNNISVDVGRYSLTVRVPGADSVVDNGKYVAVWREQPNGSLQLAADIFNSDAPPQ
jgi:ketosteroid isomerase-like protein